MAGGGFEVSDSPAAEFDGKITFSLVITCIVVASSGLIFGYDLGVSGGVSTMVPFLEKFFPDVVRKAASAETNMYCVFDSQVLTLFTSSLYLAGLVSSLAAGRVTSAMGRRNTILLGGVIFLAGGAINGGARNLVMLIVGRLLLGLGIGFTNQAGPLYLSEVAPPKWRGAFSTAFQFFNQLGVLMAGIINYFTAKHSWGWRLSLGLAVAPATIMTLGSLLISDTPTSLVERGKIDLAKKALHKVRGSNIDVQPELEKLIKSSEVAKAMKQEPFRTIFEKQFRPQLVFAIAIPFFQQLTGINIVAFYAPNLFQTVGFGNDAALLATIILGAVNLVSILVFSSIVDRCGRRFLFILGGIQMLLCLVVVAIVLAIGTGVHGTKNLEKGYTELVLVVMCIYSAGFGLSWGPLLWLIPSEIFPLKIRNTGQSIAVAVQFITIFILAQTFLTMLCHFKFAAFLFHAGWVLVMTMFITLFLPETKGIPLESIYIIWCRHWFWRRFVKGVVLGDSTD
ncbi:hypothetical protein Lal_00020226 [Lupinus albus]|uniref:Putative major facilitator, sugar transporter, major facilitator superfamily n=1 Tax=Lupinus albus TaxID=3870 RepID=A0A6A5MHJ0_LUPAL|nr:putative major facilitator, sugar transporter, major facilitator superfamily [Lupinus albus]KAF1871433.1 hypothetical protein Lal_00020226 [Lupinus albus]